MKMKATNKHQLGIDPRKEALLRSQGIDIEELFRKYANNNKFDQTSDVSSKVASGDGKLHIEEEKNGKCTLDNMYICQLCGGSGIRSIVYNHVVNDVNCEECNGDGIKNRTTV